VIRPFAPADLEPAIALWKRACGLTHAFLPQEFMDTVEKQLRAGGMNEASTVVFDDGGVRGFLTMTGNAINDFFVDPDHQGRGIGTKLLDHAKAGSPELHLSVFTRNTRAILFYDARGFLVVKRRHYPAARNEILLMKWERPQP